MENVTLLYVDDDKDMRFLFQHVIKKLPYVKTHYAESAEEGWEKFRMLSPDILITDLVMPEHNGVWLLEKVRETRNEAITIVMTAYFEEYEANQRIKELSAIPVPKSMEYDYILPLVEICVEKVVLDHKLNSLVGLVLRGVIS